MRTFRTAKPAIMDNKQQQITVTTTIQSTSSLSLPPSLASFEKARPSTTSTTASLDGPIFLSSTPSKSTTLLSRILSRSRFVLHLITAVFAFSLIGSLVAALKHYNDTKDRFLFVAGHLAWPQGLEMEDSMTLLGLGIGMAVLSSGILLASTMKCVRHNTTIGLASSAAVSVALFALSLGATIYYYTYTPKLGKSFWAWTCAHKGEKHPDIEYSLVCGELRFAWGCALGLFVTTVVLWINLGVSAFHLVCLKKEGRRTRGQSWMIASPQRRQAGLETNHAVVYSGEKV